MAVEPCNIAQLHENLPNHYENGHVHCTGSGSSDSESSEEEDDDDSVNLHEDNASENSRIAFACDDGCVRMYSVSNEKNLTYTRSLPRVSGETATPKSQSTDMYCCFGYFKKDSFSHFCRAYIECHLEF